MIAEVLSPNSQIPAVDRVVAIDIYGEVARASAPLPFQEVGPVDAAVAVEVASRRSGGHERERSFPNGEVAVVDHAVSISVGAIVCWQRSAAVTSLPSEKVSAIDCAVGINSCIIPKRWRSI